MGDDHRHREVHRLRQLRAGLQGGERRPPRALLLPDLGRAVPRARGRHRAPAGGLAERGLRRLPREVPRRRRVEELLRSQAVQPLRPLAVRAGLPRGRDLREPGRGGAGGQDVLPGLPLLRAGLSLRLPLHRPAHEDRGQVQPVLPPDHEGAHHRVLRDVPHRGPGARRPQEPEGPHSRVPAHAQGAGAQAADGDRAEGLLQRPRRLGRARGESVWRASCTASRGTCTPTRWSSSGAS